MASTSLPRCRRCGHLSYEDFVEHGLDFCDCPDGGVWPVEAKTTDHNDDPDEHREDA